MIDIGLRGDPRGEYMFTEPEHPVLAQIAVVYPQLAGLAGDRALSVAFEQTAARWYHDLTATQFDIEDQDAAAAEQMHARNQLPGVRSDDLRMHLLLSASTAGYRWRAAEHPSAPLVTSEAREWLGRYRDDGVWNASRSEVLGLAAMGIAEGTGVWRESHGGETAGFLFQAAAYTFCTAVLIEPHSITLDEELISDSFRFGIALRDAEMAYNRAEETS